MHAACFQICMAFWWLGLSAGTVFGQARGCAPVGEDAVTFHGNQDVVISMRHALRSPRGVVKAPDGSPMGGVLVEVFDHPEVVMRDGPRIEGLQHRLSACMTDETGKFDLKLASGRYEIRFSRSNGWQLTSALVHVRWFAFRRDLKAALWPAN